MAVSVFDLFKTSLGPSSSQMDRLFDLLDKVAHRCSTTLKSRF
ncbi:hypothetical protein [Roseateles sp. P5_D6]